MEHMLEIMLSIGFIVITICMGILFIMSGIQSFKDFRPSLDMTIISFIMIIIGSMVIMMVVIPIIYEVFH